MRATLVVLEQADEFRVFLKLFKDAASIT